MSIIGAVTSFFSSVLKGLDVKKVMSVIIIYFILIFIIPDSTRQFVATKFPDVSCNLAYYIFLIPVSFFLMVGLFEIIEAWRKHKQKLEYDEFKVKMIKELTSVEKELLSQFFVPATTDVINIEISDHIAQYLLGKGIIVLLSTQGRYGSYEEVPVQLSNDYAELLYNAYFRQNP
ncbi:superinfection exclusion B family protein [Citrobacter cronae]|uniref:superinfection exclusion B family protein n=1 Tax=Citrobacter cronae TaxID=1748967 RepID=UPI0021CDF026|nr:superinfection exclusion B family protein [Citrobacter cronae]MCU6199079.1 superinfection exclusion B family protein [Citrobacter cronae]